MMALSAHFAKEELVCRCCGRIGGYPENLKRLLAALERLRALVGRKIIVTCAYRCPKHNEEVGGVQNSYHTQCLAADIWVEGMNISKLAILAEEAGFKGIGRYFGQSFVHVDLGSKEVRRWDE